MPYYLINDSVLFCNYEIDESAPKELVGLWNDPDDVTSRPDMVMSMETLAKVGIKVPSCYKDNYKDKVSVAIKEAVQSVDVRVVLRLVTNNERHIHYVVGPFLTDLLYGREAGQYFAYKNDENGNPVLYAGNTGNELNLFMKSNLAACNVRNFHYLHDVYFEEAIEKLKELHLLNDVCIANEIISKPKNPNTVILKLGEDENKHPNHCEWCIQNGLDGKHHWNNDGTVYQGGGHTTHSHYQRTSKCKV